MILHLRGIVVVIALADVRTVGLAPAGVDEEGGGGVPVAYGDTPPSLAEKLTDRGGPAAGRVPSSTRTS